MNNTEMNTQTPNDIGKMIRTDIKAKWDKFSDQDLALVKNKDELVNQVTAKYGLEKSKAQGEVEALLKGREFAHQA